MTDFSDNFNRADNADINAGAPFTWASVFSAYSNWTIVGNQLQETTSVFGVRYLYCATACATLSQYAQTTLVNGAAGNNIPGVCVCVNESAGTGYAAGWNYANNTLRLIRFSSGSSETVIDSVGGSHGNGDIIRLERNDTTGDMVVKVNGTPVLAGNDTTYSGGTKVGIRGGEGGITHDDFLGGDLSAGGGIILPRRRMLGGMRSMAGGF